MSDDLNALLSRAVRRIEFIVMPNLEKNMNNVQALIDGMNAHLQRERAVEQMTLGELIEALEMMPEGAEIEGLGNLNSYRGYYSDLAFEPEVGAKTAAELLETCRAAMGQVFEGYKGGEHVMGAKTPLWLANYGSCGEKIIGINADGTVETAAEAGETQ